MLQISTFAARDRYGVISTEGNFFAECGNFFTKEMKFAFSVFSICAKSCDGHASLCPSYESSALFQGSACTNRWLHWCI